MKSSFYLFHLGPMLPPSSYTITSKPRKADSEQCNSRGFRHSCGGNIAGTNCQRVVAVDLTVRVLGADDEEEVPGAAGISSILRTRPVIRGIQILKVTCITEWASGRIQKFGIL